MLLLILLPLLLAVQIAGCYFSKKKEDARYRWWPFWISVGIYYGALVLSYHQAAVWNDSQQHCGMWILAYYFMGLLGLVFPLLQLIITLVQRWKRFMNA